MDSAAERLTRAATRGLRGLGYPVWVPTRTVPLRAASFACDDSDPSPGSHDPPGIRWRGEAPPEPRLVCLWFVSVLRHQPYVHHSATSCAVAHSAPCRSRPSHRRRRGPGSFSSPRGAASAPIRSLPPRVMRTVFPLISHRPPRHRSSLPPSEPRAGGLNSSAVTNGSRSRNTSKDRWSSYSVTPVGLRRRDRWPQHGGPFPSSSALGESVPMPESWISTEPQLFDSLASRIVSSGSTIVSSR